MYFMKSRVDHIFYFMSSSKSITCCAILFSSLLTVFAGVSTGAEKSKTDTATVKPQNEFEYLLGDRKDPFVPFITEKATTRDANLDEIVDIEGELTGMQLFEPGQLNLVALMKSDDDDYAMVEDFTGKGYVITKGTLIGKRGVVKEITPNQVVIEETAKTRAGQKIVTNIVMVLKKEEGEE